MKRTWIAALAGAALVTGSGVGVAVANAPAVEPPQTGQRAFTVQDVKPTPEPTPIEVVVEAPAPVVEAPAPAPGRCPVGTTAGQVDEAGNETNCQATNNGQPCVEYNDANQCVAWYKP